MYKVYKHTGPNGKIYIGITQKENPSDRWRNGRGYARNTHFYAAIKKYGWDRFKHEIVADGLTRAEACDLEQKLIKQYDTTNPSRGYNNTTGGDYTTYPEQTRQRIRDALKTRDYYGKNNPNYGNKKLAGLNNPRKKGGSPKKPVRCIETGATYSSIGEAAYLLGTDRRLITKALTGVNKTALGYHWEFIEG